MTATLTRTAAVAALLALGLAACASRADKPLAASDMHSSMKPAAQRHQAPDFTLKDASGKTVKLSDYKGKVVILDFWATWCTPCLIEIPWFIEFQKTYKDKGFTVLGVSMDEDGWQAVRPFLERKQLNYPVVVGSETVDQLYGGIESLPTTFIIDREGRVANMHVGLTSKREFENDIQQLLQ